MKSLTSKRHLASARILLVVSLLALVIVAVPLAKAWADTIRSDVLVIVEPNSADAAGVGLAREALGRVDSRALEVLPGEDSVDVVRNAYQALRAAVDDGQGETSYFVLKGVSPSLAYAFKKGELTQSALFSAAKEVTTLDAQSAEESRLQRVTVARSISDYKALTVLVEELNVAIADLSDEQRAGIRGDLGPYIPDFNEDALNSLVASGGDLGAEAQLELDRRAAANMPDFSGYSNGQLPDDVLCEIPWATNDRIACVALPYLQRLSDAYKAEFGEDIPILDGYRPYFEQVTVYNRDANWAAAPGTSNHGWGLAVDLGWDIFREWDTPEVQWMLENGYKYGWRLPSALNRESDRPEPWHYEFGTSYSDSDSADFAGPTPDVIFKVKLPKATR